MLDITAVKNGDVTFAEFADKYSKTDLIDLTNGMIDTMLAKIAVCTDEDVTFIPDDPAAEDPYAATEAEGEMAWTLGHVVVHVTASAEESAALAAEMARGVPLHGRSRSEVPWQTVTTVEQCRRRLEESRRMRLAGLGMWPDDPHLDNREELWPGAGEVNAIGRFLAGLAHDADHLEQMDDVIRQAKAARR